MAYNKANDLPDIQNDVLTSDTSANSKISKLNQLKTSAKRITKAINELNDKLGAAQESAASATTEAAAAKDEVVGMKTEVQNMVTEIVTKKITEVVVSNGIQNDEFACENNQTVFSLTKTPADKNNILFYINGIKYPKTDYCYHEDSNTIEWLNAVKNDQRPNAFSLKDTDSVSAIYMS